VPVSFSGAASMTFDFIHSREDGVPDPARLNAFGRD
jgi:hypothetical protein